MLVVTSFVMLTACAHALKTEAPVVIKTVKFCPDELKQPTPQKPQIQNGADHVGTPLFEDYLSKLNETADKAIQLFDDAKKGCKDE